MNLSSYYLSPKRVLEIVDQSDLLLRLKHAETFSQVGGDNLGRIAILNALEESLLRLMEDAKPPSIGEMLLQKHIEIGRVFTHRDDFYCKGITNAVVRIANGLPLRSLPYLYSKLDEYEDGLQLRVEIHPHDLTTASSAGSLSGRKNLFLLGRITAVEPKTVIAKAYTVGSIYHDLIRRPADRAVWPRWENGMEVFMEEIENFEKTRRMRIAFREDIAAMENIPEATIKAAFAEIIGEPFVPKDWGGEQSDLFTSHVRLDGRQMRTAFIFKGPSKYKPLTPADLGKNGDQIVRAFGEPADLVVLQHCHQVTSAVISIMRAFAGRIGNLKQFCVIDGAETARLLRAYGKLPLP